MKIELEHNLDQEKGLICAEKIFKNLSEQYKDEFSDLEQNIEGNTINFAFKIRGMHIKGDIKVEKNSVIIHSKLPFAAKMFQGLIESKIKENADKLMAACQ